MNNTIKESYMAISELLYDIEKAVYYFRRDNFEKALLSSRFILEKISSLLEIVMTKESYISNYMIDTQSNMQMMLENIMEAQLSTDYILLADLYQLQLANWLKGMQELILMNESLEVNETLLQKNIDSLTDQAIELKSSLNNITINHANENGYELEFTASGELTLSRTKNETKHYFHSNVSPKWEGFLLSEAWYEVAIEHYYVYGLGLGYGILELLKRSQFVDVTVIERDLDVIYLAFSNNDFSEFIRIGRLHVIHDAQHKQIGNYLSKCSADSTFVIHAPSMRNIENTAMREVLENYFVQYHSFKNQYELLQGNFNRNIGRQDASVEELKNEFKDKTVYIIAAGPSLDKNYHLLKEVKNGVILATGTVFKKLLRAGIEPHFVIVTDANPRVYAQINGVEDKQIPLIYLSTANFQFAAKYKGKKYIVCQNGFTSAEEYAKEHNYMLFDTGGSVSTTALDISIRLGCKRVVFLGLDLAYPDGFVHAEGTSRRNLASEDNLRTVIDINGKEIKTSKSLMIYKKWIEERIKGCSGVEFIDATEGGARIEGMEIKYMRDILISKGVNDER